MSQTTRTPEVNALYTQAKNKLICEALQDGRLIPSQKDWAEIQPLEDLFVYLNHPKALPAKRQPTQQQRDLLKLLFELHPNYQQALLRKGSGWLQGKLIKHLSTTTQGVTA